MKLLTTINLGSMLLAGACAVLAATLIWELLPGKKMPDTGRALPAPKTNSLTPNTRDDFNLPTLTSYREIVDRPLFVQSRRPVASEPATANSGGQTDASLNQLTLNAVIVSSAQRFALFRNTVDKKTLRIEEGKQLQGWTLKEVLPETVTLTREGQEQKFVLVRKTPDAAQLQALRSQAQARKVQQARARAAAAPPPVPANGMPGTVQARQRTAAAGQQMQGQPPNAPMVPPGVGAAAHGGPGAIPPAVPPVAPVPPQANSWR